MGNIDEMKTYKAKQALTGINKFVFTQNTWTDGVELVSANEGYKTYEIPSFVTSVRANAFQGFKGQSIKVSCKGSNITKLWGMFRRYLGDSLEVDIDTSSIESFNEMFAECYYLVNLKLGSRFKTEMGTSFLGMFQDCNYLESIEGFDFDTRNAETVAYMFSYCNSLKELDLGDKFDTSRYCSGFKGMFYNCLSLETLNLGEKFDTSHGMSLTDMFYNCSSLINISVGKRLKLTGAYSIKSIVDNTPSEVQINIGGSITEGNLFSIFEVCEV